LKTHSTCCTRTKISAGVSTVRHRFFLTGKQFLWVRKTVYEVFSSVGHPFQHLIRQEHTTSKYNWNADRKKVQLTFRQITKKGTTQILRNSLNVPHKGYDTLLWWKKYSKIYQKAFNSETQLGQSHRGECKSWKHFWNHDTTHYRRSQQPWWWRLTYDFRDKSILSCTFFVVILPNESCTFFCSAFQLVYGQNLVSRWRHNLNKNKEKISTIKTTSEFYIHASHYVDWNVSISTSVERGRLSCNDMLQLRYGLSDQRLAAPLSPLISLWRQLLQHH